MKSKQRKLLPIDIRLPERTMLDGGAMFVTLPTLKQLEDFWNAHRQEFSFAASARSTFGQQYLNTYDWVFGTTKVGVVKTALRWDQIGIDCEWYDWASSEPGEHADFFNGRESFRNRQIAAGHWTESDEQEYRQDCELRSPSTYRGYWRLTNLPGGCDDLDWFSPWEYGEIIDPNLPKDQVIAKLQEQTFDDWKQYGDDCEVEFHDSASVDETIEYWRNEQRNGEDYYGSENESG